MTLTTTTHLNFTGQAREALEFYASVFGGETTIATYAQLGMPADSPHASKVVFGQVVSDDGFRVAAYDVPAQDGPVRTPSTQRAHGTTITTEDVFVAVRGTSLEEVQGHWDALVVGGTVVEAFAPSQWSPGFGMVTDRFGVTWVLDVAAAR
jgi:PhnB protein